MRGQGRIFQRSNSPYWWIAYYANGKEYRESSGSTDRKQAGKLLRRRLKEVGADQIGARPFIGPTQERVKVRQLLDALEADYRLRNRISPQFLAHLKPIRQTFGDRRAIHVTAEAVDRYMEISLEEGKAPSTVNRETQLLGQSFRLARKRKIINFEPSIRHLPEKGNVRQGFFEAGDFKAVLDRLPGYLRELSHFAYLAGWRKQEIASLRWSDVDRDGRIIRLRPEASKNREGRTVALEGELWSIIERRWAARLVSTPSGQTLLADLVFHRQGKPVGDFRKAWTAACKTAGVGKMLFHDLRRTAIRNMVRAGVPERVAMQISGHRTRAVFDRYNIVSERDLREAAQKTDSYLKTVPSTRTVVGFPKSESVH